MRAIVTTRLNTLFNNCFEHKKHELLTLFTLNEAGVSNLSVLANVKKYHR